MTAKVFPTPQIPAGAEKDISIIFQSLKESTFPSLSLSALLFKRENKNDEPNVFDKTGLDGIDKYHHH